MNRRLILANLLGWPMGRLLAQDDPPRPHQKISAGQLHTMLSARFPVRFGMPGLLEIQIRAPRLLLLPARNRIGAALEAQVGGPGVGPVPPGEMDLVFALRYEPADRTVRAHSPEALAVRWPGLTSDALELVQGLLPGLAAQVGEVVLHQFSPRDLALPDTMGFVPEQLQVHDDGLDVIFGPKPRA
ncbi:DUF1439 domain-containing protein [Ramlibacter sp.]|uniref:DUF1439 domain-containing protein n=1 Tax=Ramlibacter sp. TaxID=1917967 RepID=UPI002D3230F9|nr:DUF1439 domain-containing protein [Ramlibacter sp.]HYD76057.1 DUF1439 domain-containing protein [Ramlibacter sp.]